MLSLPAETISIWFQEQVHQVVASAAVHFASTAWIKHANDVNQLKKYIFSMRTKFICIHILFTDELRAAHDPLTAHRSRNIAIHIYEAEGHNWLAIIFYNSLFLIYAWFFFTRRNAIGKYIQYEHKYLSIKIGKINNVSQTIQKCTPMPIKM